jgi:hypothetical protein
VRRSDLQIGARSSVSLVDNSRCAFVLPFRDEAVAAIREQRSRMRPSLHSPLEALDLLRETTLGMFLTDRSEA